MSRTAGELSAEELCAYRPWARIAVWSDARAVEPRRRLAWSAARAGAALLRTRYGAQRVLVFGSLVAPERFTPWSDVDLAMTGVPAASFYEAVGAVADLGRETGIKIDVVDLDSCPTGLRSRVEAEGEEL